MLYNTLWYFPVLMAAGGISTIIWDYRWLHKLAKKLRPARRAEQTPSQDIEASESATELTQTAAPAQPSERRRQVSSSRSGEDTANALQSDPRGSPSIANGAAQGDNEQERIVPEALKLNVFSWKFGTAIIICFFVTFIVIQVLRGSLSNRPRGFSLFANMSLAGTIIFGGGPVVIPLLSESVLHQQNLHDTT